MNQEINQTDQEKYEMYMTLEKSELAKMLVQSNKMLDALINKGVTYDNMVCEYYIEGEGTAMNCRTCNQPKWSHSK